MLNFGRGVHAQFGATPPGHCPDLRAPHQSRKRNLAQGVDPQDLGSRLAYPLQIARLPMQRQQMMPRLHNFQFQALSDL